MKVLKLIFIVIFCAVYAFCNNSKFLNPKIIIGTNYNNIEAEDQNEHSAPDRHYYKPGLLIGIENDIIINDYFTYCISLIYSKNYSMYKYSTYTGTPAAYQVYVNDYLRFSNLLGIPIYNIINIYFGIDTGVLLNNFYNILYEKGDDIYGFYLENYKINLPKIENSFCVKVSKNIYYKNNEFDFGLKFSRNIKDFKNRYFPYNKFKNQHIQIYFGYHFK
ncbi:MAG: hypothetical protein ACOC3V_05430 [bacterium]